MNYTHKKRVIWGSVSICCSLFLCSSFFCTPSNSPSSGICAQQLHKPVQTCSNTEQQQRRKQNSGPGSKAVLKAPALVGFSDGVVANMKYQKPGEARVFDGSVPPELTPALRKLREAAQRTVLKNPSDRDLAALAYRPVTPDYGFFADEDPYIPGDGKRNVTDYVDARINTSLEVSSPIVASSEPMLRSFLPVENEASLQYFHRALARLANERKTFENQEKISVSQKTSVGESTVRPVTRQVGSVHHAGQKARTPLNSESLNSQPGRLPNSQLDLLHDPTTGSSRDNANPDEKSFSATLPKNKVRILAYGASHTQADFYTGYLRAYLQSRFGNGGQGFVLAGKINRWYRPKDSTVEHKGLRRRHAVSTKDIVNEPLGLSGAAFVGRFIHGYGQITLSENSSDTFFEVHYMKLPGGGTIRILLDNELIAEVSTASQVREPGYFTFQSTPGAHQIKLVVKGDGPVRLFGVAAETADPGVVVDTLGIGGARMPNMLRWDEKTWQQVLRHREPSLVTFAYGTNEAVNTSMSIQAYEQNIRAVLLRMRKALPDVSCVLIPPLDFPIMEQGRVTNRAVIEQIVQTQQSVAKKVGCAFWNAYAFFGARGSMLQMSKQSPQLASTDLTHLTPLGYTYWGTALGDALMRRYDANEYYWTSEQQAISSSDALTSQH